MQGWPCKHINAVLSYRREQERLRRQELERVRNDVIDARVNHKRIEDLTLDFAIAIEEAVCK
jgi:hypothetical protein